jgi:hypothetical protein
VSAVLLAVLGFVFIVVLAVVVGIMDVLQAPAWRRIAAERHENWEARRLQHHVGPHHESWDD